MLFCKMTLLPPKAARYAQRASFYLGPASGRGILLSTGTTPLGDALAAGRRG